MTPAGSYRPADAAGWTGSAGPEAPTEGRITRRRAIAMAATLALAAAASGCARQPAVVADPDSTARAKANPRDKRVVALGRAEQAFTLALLKQVTGQTGNVVLSPHNLSIGLAMLVQGAGGSTLLQLLGVLHSSMGSADLAYAVNAYEQTVKTYSRTKVTARSTVYITNKLAIKSQFKSVLAKNFGTAVQRADFDDAEGAAEAMNTWVSEQTNERITSVVNADEVRSDARMTVVGGAYLLANWRQQFDPALTVDGSFRRGPKTAVRTPMMRAALSTAYVRYVSAEVLTLPYQDPALVATIIMPPLGTIDRFVKDMTQEQFATYLAPPAKQVRVDVTVPRFQSRLGVDIGPVLRRIGATDAFEGLAADFTSIMNKELHLDLVKSRSSIRCAEKGTDVAAPSAPRAAPARTGTAVNINRPFVFLVRDISTRAVLFATIVRDPSLDAP